MTSIYELIAEAREAAAAARKASSRITTTEGVYALGNAAAMFDKIAAELTKLDPPTADHALVLLAAGALAGGASSEDVVDIAVRVHGRLR